MYTPAHSSRIRDDKHRESILKLQLIISDARTHGCIRLRRGVLLRVPAASARMEAAAGPGPAPPCIPTPQAPAAAEPESEPVDLGELLPRMLLLLVPAPAAALSSYGYV